MLPSSTFRGKVADGRHAAKAHGHVFGRQDGPDFAFTHALRLPSEKEGFPGKLTGAHDALAPEQDDAQQDEREDHHAHAGDARDLEQAEVHGLLDGAQPFQQDGDDGGAQQAAGQRAQTAGHHEHQHVEGQQEVEHLGVDGGQMAAQQRAAHAREEGAHAEGEHFVAEHVDAHDARGDLVIAYAAQHIAEIAEYEPCQDDQGDDRPDVAGQQGRLTGDALDAQGTVGDGRGVDDDHADDLGKAQGGDAQVVVPSRSTGTAMMKAKSMATRPPAMTATQKGVCSTEKGQMMGSRIHTILSVPAAGCTGRPHRRRWP